MLHSQLACTVSPIQRVNVGLVPLFQKKNYLTGLAALHTVLKNDNIHTVRLFIVPFVRPLGGWMVRSSASGSCWFKHLFIFLLVLLTCAGGRWIDWVGGLDLVFCMNVISLVLHLDVIMTIVHVHSSLVLRLFGLVVCVCVLCFSINILCTSIKISLALGLACVVGWGCSGAEMK